MLTKIPQAPVKHCSNCGISDHPLVPHSWRVARDGVMVIGEFCNESCAQRAANEENNYAYLRGWKGLCAVKKKTK